ncbi:class I SAM-dependent methyltransferase [Magnetospira sp. QH-2]|uniref:class I SAM-dependent methyltransferase n=1 Tax=Magnetospira sp. (strain QH-2) TaxID=1288970 RepID=UPI0003E80A57|nr:class I SAM-dependent methyltransferase [Magnetospira sp. QH-2]CCQ75470.1 putative UbiE/COQ5 methyltransferase [Magnetospira sp. QH-2]
MSVPDKSEPTKAHIQNFWKSLYDSLYEDVDRDLSKQGLLEGLEALEDMFRYRRHMAVEEMPLSTLSGKKVLEIGPGAGGHSALFAKHGARMTSVDLTFHRARATQAKFDLLGEDAPDCRALQSDAENLPFADNCFDIVYSNGVLHHTLDTEKAMDEVFRVLRPGGQAVILLYCKSSWHYWINMLLAEGLLRGRIFKDPENWLGRATEWGGKNQQTVENPITRCYTAGGIRKLFAKFGHVTLRKGEFYFYLIPKLGKLIRARQIKRFGTHPGGILVYGSPWPIQSPLELKLGKIMGFAWYVSARKLDPAE